MTEALCPQCKIPNRSNAKFCVSCGASLPGEPGQSESPQASAQTLAPETMLQGRYQVEHELGRGGFGAVYRAWDVNLNKACAVKENMDTSPEAQRQFMREATVLANLSHPNLPRVTDHFMVAGQGQYLVMDFVEGEDLASLVKQKGVVSVNQAVAWVSQVADALVYLHTRKPAVVHRDIKPANIRTTPDGRVVLVDFGLVKMYDPSMQTTLGARAVTPGYAPPEQYGRGSTDQRSDIYALGATLYNLLTAQEPLESVQRMMGKAMRPAHQVNPQVPIYISQAIEQAMAIEPARRFQTADEFKKAISAPPVVAAPVSPVRAQKATPAAPRPARPPVDKTMLVEPVTPDRGSPQAYPSVQPFAEAQAEALPKPATRKLALGVGSLVAAGLCLVISIVLGLGLSDALGPGGESKTQTAGVLGSTQTKLSAYNTQTVQAASASQTAEAKATFTAQASPTLVALRVLFSSDGPNPGQDAQDDIYILEADGSVTTLISDPANDFGRGVSPEGQRLVFSSDRSGAWQLYGYNMTTQTVLQLTSLADQARNPAWSPDGKYIAFNSLPESGGSHLWIFAMDGSGMVKLLDESSNGRPGWSPNSAHLAFNGIRQDTNGDGQVDTNDAWDLFTVNLDGSGLTNLTNTPVASEFAPVWSPDGQWIVYASIRSDTNNDGKVTMDDNGDICKMHTDGSEMVCLTDTPGTGESDPWWTTDGRILYIVYGEQNNGLWVMDANGTNARLLLDNYGHLFQVAQIP